jgi:hypothetical protein
MSPQQRGRRFGYTIGTALIAIGAVVGIAFVVVFLVQVTGKVPTDDHTFGNNQRTGVHVDAGGSKSIYVINPHSGPPPTSIQCRVLGDPAHPIPYVRRYNFDFIPTSQWRAQFYFKVKDGGNYTVSCSGPSNVRYGVGEYVGVEQFTPLFWAIAAGVVLAIAGFATFVVTTVRRA